jgi:hypothetical protein
MTMTKDLRLRDVPYHLSYPGGWLLTVVDLAIGCMKKVKIRNAIAIPSLIYSVRQLRIR